MKSIELKTTLIIDLFFCVVFMPLLVFLGPVHYWIGDTPGFLAAVCCYFYGCYFVMKYINIPRRIVNRQYRLLCCVGAGIIAGNWLLTHYPLPALDFVTPMMSAYQTHIRNYSVALSLWLMLSLVAGYAVTTTFVQELYDQLLEKRRAETRRDKAELAMFRAQISPHFLFNTLNSLYSLVVGTRAEDAFVKFTDILKYTYSSAARDKVSIREEADYISGYIALQQLRLNAHTRVIWESEIYDEEAVVAPMIMLTFLENCFKYGSSTSEDCTISISLRCRDGELSFATENRVMRHSDDFRTTLPVGIENCRSRLESLYPGRHSLHTSEIDGVYRLNLQIIL